VILKEKQLQTADKDPNRANPQIPTDKALEGGDGRRVNSRD
jgi:hypothetical protein